MSAAPVHVGAALEFVQRQDLGYISQVTINVTLATTPTVILQNNSDRVELIMFNLDVVDSFVLTDASVSTTNGFKMVANGGFLIFKLKDDFTFLTLPFWGVAASATAKLTVTEIFRVNAQTRNPI